MERLIIIAIGWLLISAVKNSQKTAAKKNSNQQRPVHSKVQQYGYFNYSGNTDPNGGKQKYSQPRPPQPKPKNQPSISKRKGSDDYDPEMNQYQKDAKLFEEKKSSKQRKKPEKHSEPMPLKSEPSPPVQSASSADQEWQSMDSMHENLWKAVVFSEILGKPKALK